MRRLSSGYYFSVLTGIFADYLFMLLFCAAVLVWAIVLILLLPLQWPLRAIIHSIQRHRHQIKPVINGNTAGIPPLITPLKGREAAKPIAP